MASTCLITGVSAILSLLFVMTFKVPPSVFLGFWLSLLFVVSGWSVVRSQKARAEFEAEASAALRAAHAEQTDGP